MNNLKNSTLKWLSKFREEIRNYYSKLKIISLIFFGIFFSTSSSLNAITYPSLEEKPPITRNIAYLNVQTNRHPEIVSSNPLPNLSAEGFFVLEPNSFKTLASKNPTQRFYPASITKLLTALTALDYYSLDEVLTIPKMGVEGQVMGLVEGEKISVRNLLYGLLIKSANDAAMVLASSEKVNYDQFIYSMNEKAISLSMLDTHFNNPTGLDDENHYTTPKDAVLLGAFVYNHPLISEIVKIKKTTVTDVDKKIWHELENVNSLLGENGVEGIKTGWTEKALQNFLFYSKVGDQSVVGVVLKSNDRFGESRSLIQWSYQTYSW